jgi:SAM-dependent methyltransferase
MGALDAWCEQLAAWVIPEPVLAGATDSPWVLPHAVFVRRVDRQLAQPAGASYAVASAALAEPGSVLDVGCGAGAASLPLAGRMTSVTGVDDDPDLLKAFQQRAARLKTACTIVRGRWPAVAAQVGSADLVVCGHVLYNVAELGPFVAELSARARRRVVVEITERHPLVALNPLWRRFHGIRRPEGPTARDAIAALAEIGVQPRITAWSKPAEAEYETFDDLVEVTRRRLCLPVEATGEVQEALLDLGVAEGTPPDLGSSGRQLVTLDWHPGG